jgi:mono/diheme cytochrome c family protein
MIRARHRFSSAAIVILGVLLASFASHAQSSAEDDAGLVARGEYLARAADCMPCHSGDRSKPYSGGLPLHTPFGTIFSVNITSDPQTGIGQWSFADFKNAVHNGTRADGAYLYPAMPFDAYAGIEEDDLKALWAFVRRIPPVNAPNRPDELSFPFDIRTGMLAWRELFFSPAYFKPTAGKSTEWNRGAYLVEVLGHCSDCHSPRNIMGAIKGKAQFTGTQIDGFYAPDIASAALAKSWSKDSLVQFLRTGSVPQRSAVFGPMAEVVHNSLAYLTPADVGDIATYLLDSPPPPDAPAPQSLSPLPAEVYHRSAKLYIDNCAPCHQDHGSGIPGAVPPLADNPAVIPAQPDNILMVVLGGLPASGTYSAMPSFAGRLSDSQIADLANYIRTSWGNRAAPNATASIVAAWRGIANIPDFGTQAAIAFDCPRVGGAPGVSGPNPQAVADLAAMIQAGDRKVADLAANYQREMPDAGHAEVVDALMAAYCPTVAASSAPTYQKFAVMRQFARDAEAAVATPARTETGAELDVIWAVPVGHTLVYREPRPFAGKLVCPSDNGKLVPQDLVKAAAALLGRPTLPVPGNTASDLAVKFASSNPKAAPANAANALITAYCTAVTATASVEQAVQRAWVQDFGAQVIQALQSRTLASQKR